MGARKVVRLPEVAKTLGVSKPTIYNWIARGAFPAPIKIGRCSAWLSTEVDEWLADHVAQRAMRPTSQEFQPRPKLAREADIRLPSLRKNAAAAPEAKLGNFTFTSTEKPKHPGRAPKPGLRVRFKVLSKKAAFSANARIYAYLSCDLARAMGLARGDRMSVGFDLRGEVNKDAIGVCIRKSDDGPRLKLGDGTQKHAGHQGEFAFNIYGDLNIFEEGEEYCSSEISVIDGIAFFNIALSN